MHRFPVDDIFAELFQGGRISAYNEMTADEYKQYLLFKYKGEGKEKEQGLKGQELVDHLKKKYKK